MKLPTGRLPCVLLAALLLRCAEPSGPETPSDPRGPLDIATAPLDKSVVTSPQTVAALETDSLGFTIGSTDTFSGDLDYTIQYMVNSDPSYAPREAAVNPGDTLTVCIDGCVPGRPWTARVRDPAETVLLVSDSLPTDTVSFQTRFRILFAHAGKGYLAFQECIAGPGQPTPTGLDIVVRYTCDYIDSLYLATDSLLWMYDTTGPSTLRLRCAGKTNAYHVGVATHGDAQPGVYPLHIGADGTFCDTVPLASSSASGYVLPHSTTVYVLGTVGPARDYQLLNPRRP
jgi:hypothetical protein